VLGEAVEGVEVVKDNGGVENEYLLATHVVEC
jgi:hypothetical protein